MTAKGVRHLLTAMAFAFVATAGVIAPDMAAASEIKYIVNGTPVTDYDIARRTAFLRLQRRRGNLREPATQEMIDQALRSVEIRRLGIGVSDAAVDRSFAGFARSNQMSVGQMSRVLAESGVTGKHFREFIRVQMGWSQALDARFRAEGGGLSEQDVVQRMLQDGGRKPTATEYVLQQVIFVVPSAERKSKLNGRKREAQAMRDRFESCDTTREFAKGLIDVTVRDLGRVLEPELPPDWEKPIRQTKKGAATRVRVTDRGVEFIGICDTHEVDDDRVAQTVFRNEGSTDERSGALSDRYMTELKKKARIVKR